MWATSCLPRRRRPPSPATRDAFRRTLLAVVLAVAPLVGPTACRWVATPPVAPPSPSAPPAASPVPGPTPTPLMVRRPVKRASEEVVVAAWAEPARLPPQGGQARLFVRAQKRNGQPFPGVEVRLEASQGRLQSRGRLLITDAAGMASDRLTTRATASVVLNAGGTRYKFDLPVAEAIEQRR